MTTSPFDIPQWNRLAEHSSIYGSAEWLAFVDALWPMQARYLCLSHNGNPVAALPVHQTPRDNGPDLLVMGGHKGNLGYLGLDAGLTLNDQDRALGQVVDIIEAVAKNSGMDWAFEHLDSATAKALMRVFRQRGLSDIVPQVQAVDSILDVSAPDIETHIATLKSGTRRSNFRREIRRFDVTGLTVRKMQLQDSAAIMGPLLANVQGKYGHDDSVNDKIEILRMQGKFLSQHAIAFGCFDGLDCVAYALFFRFGKSLALRTIGFDYDRLDRSGGYTRLGFVAPLLFAAEARLPQILLGTETYQAKTRRGARLRPLWRLSTDSGTGTDILAQVQDQVDSSDLDPMFQEISCVQAH